MTVTSWQLCPAGNNLQGRMRLPELSVLSLSCRRMSSCMKYKLPGTVKHACIKLRAGCAYLLRADFPSQRAEASQIVTKATL